MKRLFFPLIVVTLFYSCSKNTSCSYSDSTVTASAAEILNIQNYLTANGITGAQQHSSGVFYKINVQGNGQAIANLCSNLAVEYKGSLAATGVVFDSTVTGNPISLQLGGVIAGWQKGLPLISKGGTITLYIPPSLGYGSVDVKDQNNVVVIPANSILIFTIKLDDISN